MDVLFIVLVVLAIGAALGFRLYAAWKRRAELTRWAEECGLEFNPARDYGVDSRYSDFKCLHHGRNRYALNVISGALNDRQLTAFDYRYTAGSGKNRRTHVFSAMIVDAPIPLKPLFIRREGFFDKITEFFGADDIDFESAEFSRKFFVKAPDRKWACDVIHQRMREYLLTAPSFSIQFSEDSIIAWSQTKFSPGDFQSAFDMIEGMLQRLPEHLSKQQTGQ